MKLGIYFILLLLSIQLFTAPRLVSVAHAQTSFSIESIGAKIGVGQADLKQTILNILRWVLGILALAAVFMIIFSGFIAATTSDSERGEAARRTIVNALIGLIIVLLAWAIVIFVARTTSNVTVNT